MRSIGTGAGFAFGAVVVLLSPLHVSAQATPQSPTTSPTPPTLGTIQITPQIECGVRIGPYRNCEFIVPGGGKVIVQMPSEVYDAIKSVK